MSDDATTQRGPSAHAPPAMVGALALSSHRDGESHTLCLSGELDIANVDLVHDELARIESSGASSIVIDLAGLTFMDSTGIQLLVRAHARSRTDAHRLTLRPGPAAVQRVFTLCGVDELLPFGDPTDPSPG